MKNAFLLTLMLVAFGSQAYDAKTECREWAEQDGIPADQMAAYMEECTMNMGAEIEVSTNEAESPYEQPDYMDEANESEPQEAEIID